MNKKTIIITGSTSGLGYALAQKYASPCVCLMLFGRNIERLELIKNYCAQRGGEVFIYCGDVTDKLWMQTQISEICQNHKVDILIACAGVSAGTLGGPETRTQTEQIFAVNLNGTINTIMPAIPFMINNQMGQIVLISSMAGMLGLSSAPSYSASKASVKVFGDALRAYLKKWNVKVCVVIPGYIDTPMTKVNNFSMPFLMSPERAASLIIHKLSKGSGIIAFPLVTYYFMKIINLLPYQLIDYINSKLPGKPSFEEQKN